MMFFDAQPSVLRDLENAAGNLNDANFLYLAGCRTFDDAEKFIAQSGQKIKMVTPKNRKDMFVTLTAPKGELKRKSRK